MRVMCELYIQNWGVNGKQKTASGYLTSTLCPGPEDICNVSLCLYGTGKKCSPEPQSNELNFNL